MKHIKIADSDQGKVWVVELSNDEAEATVLSYFDRVPSQPTEDEEAEFLHGLEEAPTKADLEKAAGQLPSKVKRLFAELLEKRVQLDWFKPKNS